MSKGTVVIKESGKGCMGVGLTKFTAAWPSGKTFEKFVDAGDAVNERRRQERFIESRGYTVKWDMEGTIEGD